MTSCNKTIDDAAKNPNAIKNILIDLKKRYEEIIKSE